jgi:long-chain acyl-CoA synthetase
MKTINLAFKFLQTLKNPNFETISSKKNNIWENTSREKLNNMINNCILILKDKNVVKGDRVIYKGGNSVEWLSWNLATHFVGGVWVPMYSDQNIDHCKYIISDCQPKLFISETKLNLDNVNIIDNYIENLDYNDKEFDIVNNDLSTLIYTSGTTGNPKGVMLTHENIISNLEGIRKRFDDIESNKTSLNILPWAHIYSMTCELYYNLFYDNKTAICSSKENFINECKEIKPEVLYIVPKVLETVKNKVSLLDKPIIRIILPIILKSIFGNNLENIFMGGAKLDNNTKLFYENNGIKICEGYGCSETSPIISVNHVENPRDIQSVGKILDNVIVDIINDEICVSGPSIMKGYWNDPEKTDEVIIRKNNNRFYKTGDSGYTKDGYLYFNGRISENYKMSNGKFVNVSNLESKIKKHINTNFIVYGENMDHNILVVEKPFDKKNIDLINKEIENYLNIKEIIEVESEEMQKYLTPKLSIKRKLLINNYIK